MPFTIAIDMPLNAMNQTAAPATIISVDTFPDRPRQTSHAPVPLGSSHPGQSWEVVQSLGSYDGSAAMAKTIEEHILILIFDELPAQCRNDPRLHCRLPPRIPFPKQNGGHQWMGKRAYYSMLPIHCKNAIKWH